MPFLSLFNFLSESWRFPLSRNKFFMKRTHVISSVLRSYAYDPQSKIFEVKIVTGEVYQYFDVQQDMFDGFLNAKSKGVYYNTVIKPGRKYEQIELF